ncbi:hypothetical protein HPB48_016392 [Haemaphysalis longicornis]|uniref:MATH domain-containing protein n=1 Tax=Haemaphysalis longicornis TaxID=44386 RepID=A0A9J6FCV5_HAELO|nr:hypothetical protein HPB48_016392 [Haemaphysalis longicornis]
MRREETGQEIESPTFSTAAPGDMKWCLQLYPNGLNGQMKGYLSLYLWCVSSYFNPVPVEYEFAVLDERGHKFSVKRCFERISQGYSSGFERFVDRDCLLKSTDRLLPNDKLTIYCEGLAFVGSENISSPNKAVAVNVPDCDLSQSLRHLLVSRRFSDVIFSVQGERDSRSQNCIGCP